MKYSCKVHCWLPYPDIEHPTGYLLTADALLKGMSPGHVALQIELPVTEATTALYERAKSSWLSCKKITLKTSALYIDPETHHMALTERYAYEEERYVFYWSFNANNAVRDTSYAKDCNLHAKKIARWTETARDYIEPSINVIKPSPFQFLTSELGPFLGKIFPSLSRVAKFIPSVLLNFINFVSVKLDRFIAPVFSSRATSGPKDIIHLRGVNAQIAAATLDSKKELDEDSERLDELLTIVLTRGLTNYDDYLRLDPKLKAMFFKYSAKVQADDEINIFNDLSEGGVVEETWHRGNFFGHVVCELVAHKAVIRRLHKSELFSAMHYSTGSPADDTIILPVALAEGDVGLNVEAMVAKMSSLIQTSKYELYGVNCAETALQILAAGTPADITDNWNTHAWPYVVVTPYMAAQNSRALAREFDSKRSLSLASSSEATCSYAPM